MSHVGTDLGAYVLGGLDAEAAARVRTHLAGCEDCRAAHADLAGLPALLDLAAVAGAAEDDPLPPAIEERLLDRFAREHAPEPPRSRWRPRLALGGAAFAGAAVAAAVLIFALNFERNGGRPATQYQLAFQRAGAAPVAASARAALRTTDGGTLVRLWVSDLPVAAGDDVYEVFCDAKGWSASAGTFRVDAKGNAYVILTTAVKRGQYDRIRVVRRAHGSDGSVKLVDMLGAKLS